MKLFTTILLLFATLPIYCQINNEFVPGKFPQIRIERPDTLVLFTKLQAVWLYNENLALNTQVDTLKKAASEKDKSIKMIISLSNKQSIVIDSLVSENKKKDVQASQSRELAKLQGNLYSQDLELIKKELKAERRHNFFASVRDLLIGIGVGGGVIAILTIAK